MTEALIIFLDFVTFFVKPNVYFLYFSLSYSNLAVMVISMVSWIFIGFVASILFTPGPTNTLLASSGVNVGFKKSILLIPAEAFGYLIAITAWGILIDRVAIHAPFVPSFLKLCSAVYILFLAFKLWKSSFEQVTLFIPFIRKRELFLATLLNPKGILFATAVFPAIAFVNADHYVAHMLSFLLLLIPVGFFWILMGKFLNSGKIRWLNQAVLQRTATVILILFAAPLSYSAISGFSRL